MAIPQKHNLVLVQVQVGSYFKHGDIMVNKVLKPNVLLGYVLTVRDKVTLTELKAMKKRIEKVTRDPFVDLDENLIYQAEEEYPTKFHVDLENNDIVVYSKEKFTLFFLNTCFRYLFRNRTEFEAVKKIMLEKPHGIRTTISDPGRECSYK